ncbi:hypothetical protein T484DRAFT_3146665 [Baffinella frigidus]|nr:hypothetical protein T484DRAFT_3146665 [Cryptophyta sp. CCMP2293]
MGGMGRPKGSGVLPSKLNRQQQREKNLSGGLGNFLVRGDGAGGAGAVGGEERAGGAGAVADGGALAPDAPVPVAPAVAPLVAGDQDELARLRAENLALEHQLRSRVGAPATGLLISEVMFLDSIDVIPGDGSSAEVRVTSRGSWLQKMKGDQSWIFRQRGAEAGDVAPIRAGVSWQRVHGAHTVEFSVTISRDRSGWANLLHRAGTEHLSSSWGSTETSATGLWHRSR